MDTFSFIIDKIVEQYKEKTGFDLEEKTYDNVLNTI